LAPSRSKSYVFTGTAVGNYVLLPDATQCQVGTELEFTNGSSEFLGVHLYGTAAYSFRLPPRGSGKLKLVDNSTAAGTWAGGSTDLGSECRGNLVLYGNFATYATTNGTNDGGFHYINGTGALSRSSNPNDAAQAVTMGFTETWWYGYCGTQNGGYSHVRYGALSTLGGWYMIAGPYMYEARFSLDALPTAAEDWTVSLGAVGGTYNCRMVLDRTIGGGTNYHLQAQNGAGATNTNSGVLAVARTPTRMRVEKTRAGDRQDLWINGVWRCQSAGGPAGAGPGRPGAGGRHGGPRSQPLMRVVAMLIAAVTLAG
jgi:hypothetical protein